MLAFVLAITEEESELIISISNWYEACAGYSFFLILPSMITPEEFNELPLSQKAQCIYEYGNYLLHRKGERHVCCLYALWFYFAEVLYSKENDTIIDVWALDKSAKIDIYLEGLTIEGLL